MNVDISRRQLILTSFSWLVTSVAVLAVYFPVDRVGMVSPKRVRQRIFEQSGSDTNNAAVSILRLVYVHYLT